MKVFPLLFFCLAALGLGAQESTVIDTIAQETCTCVEDKLATATGPLTEMDLGLCIIQSANGHMTAYEAEFGTMDLTDVPAMTKVGERVGMRMAVHCPAVLMQATGQLEDDLPPPPPPPAPAAPARELETLTGTIQSIEAKGPITVVTLLPAGGSPQTFWWLEYFPGSERLGGAPIAIGGEEVTITYERVGIYAAGVEEYIVRRVLRGVE